MNKYNSRKVTVNGITFDSKKESRRYEELLLLERAGIIQNLQMQVPFTVIPQQTEITERYSTKTGNRLKDKITVLERETTYIADFTYQKNGELVVEDVKGYKNSTAYAVFVIKRKLMLQVHGIRVKEV